MTKLNLGCGKTILPDYINIDYIWSDGVDFVMNFNKDCLPFDDDSIDEILLNMVLEHLINPYEFMMECHRILKPRGIIIVNLPAFCPTLQHQRYFHHDSYFKCLTTNHDRTLQNQVFFSEVYVKHSFRSFNNFFWNFINLVKSLFIYEYEYKLKKM